MEQARKILTSEESNIIKINMDEETQVGHLQLEELPVEILILIFDYCHAFDLIRIGQVCTRFQSIIRDDFLWYRRRKRALATNQASKKFRKR